MDKHILMLLREAFTETRRPASCQNGQEYNLLDLSFVRDAVDVFLNPISITLGRTFNLVLSDYANAGCYLSYVDGTPIRELLTE